MERRRNSIERAWAHNLHATETRETVTLKGQLRAAKNTIKRLKQDVDTNGQEVMMLRSKLWLAKAHLDVVNTQLCHVERKAYERGFEECKALAVQILSLAEANMLQILILATSHAFATLQTSRGRG